MTKCIECSGWDVLDKPTWSKHETYSRSAFHEELLESLLLGYIYCGGFFTGSTADLFKQ